MQDLRLFSFRGRSIPERMHGGIWRYLINHLEPGGFLLAVLSNDLRVACARADNVNIDLLPVYVAYFYNEAPMGAWGSPEKVKAWLAAGPVAALPEYEA